MLESSTARPGHWSRVCHQMALIRSHSAMSLSTRVHCSHRRRHCHTRLHLASVLDTPTTTIHKPHLHIHNKCCTNLHKLAVHPQNTLQEMVGIEYANYLRFRMHKHSEALQCRAINIFSVTLPPPLCFWHSSLQTRRLDLSKHFWNIC